MIIDKEEHRNILLQLIDQSTIPGSAVDIVYELKQQIVTATCVELDTLLQLKQEQQNGAS